MKRIFLLSAAVVAMALSASCSRLDRGDDIITCERDVTVDFRACSPSSKASAAYADESLINDVTLFVFRRSSGDSAEEFFLKTYTQTGNATVRLIFPEGEDYEYEFRAYANFGRLSEEPGTVAFDGEFASGMRMTGAVTVDAEAAASDVSILMKRLVGKVVINSIKLDWDSAYAEPFTLDAIYIANAGKDNSLMAESYYNPEGVRSVSSMDAYLTDDFEDVPMEAGDIYSAKRYFYGYAGFTSTNLTSVVIECTYDGQKMYYTIPVSLDANTCTVYDYIIRGAGYDAPYGEKMDITKSSVDVVVRTFTVDEWVEVSETVYSEDSGYIDTDVDVDTGWN